MCIVILLILQIRISLLAINIKEKKSSLIDELFPDQKAARIKEERELYKAKKKEENELYQRKIQEREEKKKEFAAIAREQGYENNYPLPQVGMKW